MLMKKLQREAFYRGHPYRVVATKKRFEIYRLGCEGHETEIHSEKRDDPQRAFHDNAYVGRVIGNEDPFWERARVADDVTEARKVADLALIAEARKFVKKPEEKYHVEAFASPEVRSTETDQSTVRYEGTVKAQVPTYRVVIDATAKQFDQHGTVLDTVTETAKGLTKFGELRPVATECLNVRTNGKVAMILQDRPEFTFFPIDKGPIDGSKPYPVGTIRSRKDRDQPSITVTVDPYMRFDDDRVIYFLEEKPVWCTKFEGLTA